MKIESWPGLINFKNWLLSKSLNYEAIFYFFPVKWKSFWKLLLQQNGPLKDQTKTTTSNFFFKCYFLVFRQITLFSTNNVVSQFLSSKLEWSSCKNNFCSVFCKMYIPTHTLEKYVCINFQIYFKKLAVYYSFILICHEKILT